MGRILLSKNYFAAYIHHNSQYGSFLHSKVDLMRLIHRYHYKNINKTLNTLNYELAVSQNIKPLDINNLKYCFLDEKAHIVLI